jgi:PPK2 family polyphosphate:nucleotide phosphotransferase
MEIQPFRIAAGQSIDLHSGHLAPAYQPDGFNKQEATEKLAQTVQQIAELQDKMYAQGHYGLLVTVQALDAAGKDSLIKHVFTGVNPEGCQVSSFKVPTATDLAHTYLWRYMRELPERGMIGIFNRSYYEEVLVVRVHPEALDQERVPPTLKGKEVWKSRYEEINDLERHLVNNGIQVVKFFLNLSKAEQAKRFEERINESDKHWKVSSHDVIERGFWDEYQKAFQEMIEHTSTDWAPWYVLPADHKPFTHLLAAEVIRQTLAELPLAYPAGPAIEAEVDQARQQLRQMQQS